MSSSPVFLRRNESELWMINPLFPDLLLTGENVDPVTNARFTIGVRATTSQSVAAASAMSWGEAQPIDVAVQRWLTDGAVAQTMGNDDRTIVFPLKVSAADSANLAAGEAALQLRAEQRVSLKWVSPEGAPDAPATVFEVSTWHLGHGFDLDDEMRLSRLYALTATAFPWARSADLNVVDAVPTAGSPVTTDYPANTAAWTGSPNPRTISGTSIIETVAVGKSPAVQTITLTIKRQGSITGAGPYLRLTVSTSGGASQGYTVTADDVALEKVSQAGEISYWALPPGVTSVTTLVFSTTFVVQPFRTPTLKLEVADTASTNQVGGIGSAMQLTRSLDVGGSVRTAGSIEVASPSSTPLGTVLVYTAPDNGMGYTTGLRQYRTSGNPLTADTQAVSGFHEALVTSGSPVGLITYSIPANVLPEASYAVVARFHAAAAAELTVGSIAFTGVAQENAALNNPVVDLVAGWNWAVLGILHFPLLPLPAESQVPSGILLEGFSPSGTITLDEVYLLDVTHGDFTLLDCGAATRLWLDAPDADPIRNRKACYIGTLDDRSDAATVPGDQILFTGDHHFDPRGTVVATTTDNVNNAAVSAAFYHRWNTHAGD